MDSSGIDFSQIPKIELELFCAALLKAAKEFYDDPKNMARFQEWQKERQGTHQTSVRYHDQSEGRVIYDTNSSDR